MKRLAPYVAPVVACFLRLFFKRDYLRGRYFTGSFSGYRWALHALFCRHFLRLAPPMPWPAHFSCYVSNPENIHFDPEDINNFQARGAYFQCIDGKIVIGKRCYIAANVGLITQNHDPTDLSAHLPPSDIVLGDQCWIGMNAVILPGVVLGPNTIVAAGAVVNKSHEDGNVVLGGIPARVLRKTRPDESSEQGRT